MNLLQYKTKEFEAIDRKMCNILGEEGGGPLGNNPAITDAWSQMPATAPPWSPSPSSVMVGNGGEDTVWMRMGKAS